MLLPAVILLHVRVQRFRPGHRAEVQTWVQIYLPFYSSMHSEYRVCFLTNGPILKDKVPQKQLLEKMVRILQY